ncbi:hypothetical protein [Tenacibaculum agarivorans]|uniref:hypothetical protein n=1 Tax=Tenacibaculum agarivorans TaxID=1908389 RepID=UPI00094B8E56|nr:hypothetical protein [Tenacibaculum agarivorans]
MNETKQIKGKGSLKGCSTLIAIFFGISLISNLIPETKDDFFRDAELNYDTNNYELALTKVNEAIQLDSTNSDYYELRGKILHELQDTIQSNQDFNKTLALAKSDTEKDARIRKMIEWDLNHGEEEKARQLLSKEIQLYKEGSLKHIEVIDYAARKYLTIGDTIEAIRLYDLLSNEYVTTGKYSNKAGILYTNIKKKNKAISEFKKAVDAAPENDIFLYNLGIAYLNSKNKRQAKMYFKKSMDFGNTNACHEYRELTARIRYYKRSRCCDGTTSSSTGRGSCSHHGGVCGIENVPYKEYTISCY